jgi:hypothetical protein
MPDIIETLRAKKAEIKESIRLLQIEDREIDTAISAIEDGRSKIVSAVGTIRGTGTVTGVSAVSSNMGINEGIVEAVKNGADSPAKIFHFLKPHLGIETTKNSVNTRLGKLRDNGRIAYRDGRWVPATKEKRATEGDALQ